MRHKDETTHGALVLHHIRSAPKKKKDTYLFFVDRSCTRTIAPAGNFLLNPNAYLGGDSFPRLVAIVHARSMRKAKKKLEAAYPHHTNPYPEETWICSIF